MRLAYALTATDMRMRENDVILGIPKSSYIRVSLVKMHCYFGGDQKPGISTALPGHLEGKIAVL